MSFLKNIIGAFVELKDENVGEINKSDTRENGKTRVDSAAANTGSKSHSAASETAAAASGNQSSMSGFQQHFEDLIEEANTKNALFQGTDFKEFIESKSDVEAIADEATKYRTAFNVLKRTGLTKERLVTTGQEYINIIDRDLNEFEKAFNHQYKNDVEHKEQLLQQKAQELQILNEKISLLNNEIKQMSQQIIESKNKLNNNKNSFILAGENKKKEINVELQKIQEYFS